MLDKMRLAKQKRVRMDNIRNFFEKPETIFCTLATVAGLLMLFLLPLFRAPDEMAHFARAYQVSQGQIVSQNDHGRTGGVIPQIEGYNFHNKLTPETYLFFDFSSSAVYSPISYIPQAIGIAIGKLIYPSVAVMVYAGRIVNLIAYIAMLYAAIKIAKRGKWVYAVVGLIPMAIQQAGSLSADVMTLGPVFLFIATVQNLFTQTTLLTKKQAGMLIALSAVLGLTKQTNVLLLLALLFIPKRLFASTWHKYRLLLLTLGIGVVLALGWYMITRMLHYNFSYALNNGVSQAGQIDFILHHPLSAFTAFFTTFFGGQSLSSPADFIMISMIGYFSWFDYKLPLFLIIVSYLLLLVTLLRRDDEKAKDSKTLVWSHAAIFAASIAAVALALYISWTPVGQGYIIGLQGRYFLIYIPLLIPLFAWLGRFVQITLKPYLLGMIVTAVSFINLLAMIVLTYKWFY